MPTTRKPWASKTIWITWLLSTLAFIPGADVFIAANPTLIPIGFSVLATILRMVSNGKVALTE